MYELSQNTEPDATDCCDRATEGKTVESRNAAQIRRNRRVQHGYLCIFSVIRRRSSPGHVPTVTPHVGFE